MASTGRAVSAPQRSRGRGSTPAARAIHTIVRRATLVALCLLAACADAMGPGSDEAGVYHLETVNGKTLPTPFFEVELLSASASLDEDGRYRHESTVRGADALGDLVTQTTTESGTYTRTGNQLTFTSTVGEVTTAAYNGRTLTVREGDLVLVYRRTPVP